MHFARPGQLIAMIFAWTLLLVAYDQHANPRPLVDVLGRVHGELDAPHGGLGGGHAARELSMPHLCCSGCLNEIRAALRSPRGSARRASSGAGHDRNRRGERGGLGESAAGRDLGRGLDRERDRIRHSSICRGPTSSRSTRRCTTRGSSRTGSRSPGWATSGSRSSCRTSAQGVRPRRRRPAGAPSPKKTQGAGSTACTTTRRKTVTIYARINAVVDLVELTRRSRRRASPRTRPGPDRPRVVSRRYSASRNFTTLSCCAAVRAWNFSIVLRASLRYWLARLQTSSAG